MLTLSAALTTTQKLGSRTPNIKVDIIEAEGSSPTVATYYSAYKGTSASRILSIENTEASFGGELTKITLFDGNKGIASKDWTGRRLAIFYGYDSTGNGTGAKSEDWQERAPLWVITHEETRGEGEQNVVLICGDIWYMLTNSSLGGTANQVVPPYTGDEISDYLYQGSPEGLLNRVIPSGYNTAIDSSVSYGVPLTIDDSDGLVDSANHQIDFEFEWGTPTISAIQSMMTWTKGGLRMRKP